MCNYKEEKEWKRGLSDTKDRQISTTQASTVCFFHTGHFTIICTVYKLKCCWLTSLCFKQVPHENALIPKSLSSKFYQLVLGQCRLMTDKPSLIAYNENSHLTVILQTDNLHCDLTKPLECNALSAALRIMPCLNTPGHQDRQMNVSLAILGCSHCSALTWDVANSDAKRWQLSPVSPFLPPLRPFSDTWRGSACWRARRGRVYKAHTDTWCQKACVHSGGVSGGMPAALLRCQPSFFILHHTRRTKRTKPW